MEIKTCSHKILDSVVIKVSAALREAVQQDFDQTLVPGWTHGQETILQYTTVPLQQPVFYLLETNTENNLPVVQLQLNNI